MIARIWKGAVRRDDADEYAAYIADTGLAEYRETPGNQGAWLLRRDDGDRTEFIAFTFWDSMESVRAFAGDDPEKAVYYPKDDAFLVEREDTVKHYDAVGGD
jgi:heme-degrading monooxygenase HmoA